MQFSFFPSPIISKTESHWNIHIRVNFFKAPMKSFLQKNCQKKYHISPRSLSMTCREGFRNKELTRWIKLAFSIFLMILRQSGKRRMEWKRERIFPLNLHTFRSKLTRVGNTWLTCMIVPWSWRNMVMIMPWWHHGGHVSWHGRHDSWHDHAIFHDGHIMILSWSYHGEYESPWSYHVIASSPWLSTRGDA